MEDIGLIPINTPLFWLALNGGKGKKSSYTIKKHGIRKVFLASLYNDCWYPYETIRKNFYIENIIEKEMKSIEWI